MLYINTEKINKFKNLDNNYYVIADFDHTLTTDKSTASMGIIPKYLGGKCLEQRLKIYNHYRPLELDYTIDRKQKQELMREWATRSFTLLSKYIESEETIKNSLEDANLYLRKGTKEFLKNLNNKNVPVIIMSAGVGNIVKEFLKKEQCLYNNIEIVSNFFEFSNGSTYIDIKNIIATSNKKYERIPKNILDKVKDKKSALLLGDLIEDIKMAKQEELDNILTIGFLDENIEQNLEKYNNNFDIVLTEDSNFNDVKNILNIY